MTHKTLLDEFLSEPEELHALWFGFLFSWRAFRRELFSQIPEEFQNEIKRQYNYYTLGFFIGRVLQAGILLFLIYKDVIPVSTLF